MRKDKQQALHLRKKGKSYNEISQLLAVPKSTLSGWLSGHKWSDKIKDHLALQSSKYGKIRLKELNKIRGGHLAKVYNEARSEARMEFGYFKLHPLFVAGICIYWGEGNKTTMSHITISNSDPLMVRLYVKFLLEVCGVSKNKIRAYVLLYPDIQEQEAAKFWIAESGLSKENFTKSVHIQGRHKTRRLTYGVCTVGVFSSYLKQKMLVWLKLLPQELAKASYYPRV